MGPTNLYALSHQGGSLHASSKNSDVLQKSWIRNTTAETNAKMFKNVWENAVKKEDPVEESLTWSDSHDESQLLDAKINWI